MFNINDMKNGMTFSLEGSIYLILEFQHVKPGKGPAFIRTKLKNLKTGATIEKTFNTNIKLEKAMIDKNSMQFLYADGDKYNFMNMESYDQIELSKSEVGDAAQYLIEGLNVDITFHEGIMIGLELPEKIEYTVVSAEPAVKGNTAQGALKDAELENGLKVKVPLFIEENEKIIISRHSLIFAYRHKLL